MPAGKRWSTEVSWRDYWNSDNPIYASERHKVLHYRGIAGDLLALIDELFPGERPVVLDYGCGQALEADRVAQRCARLHLADSAPTVVESLRQRFAGNPAINVLAANAVALLPGGSIDLVVVNSVIQYLTRAELDIQLAIWRSKLSARGTLVLADIIPPDIGPLTDAGALLRFAARGGFLVAAFSGLVRTAFSDYRKLRGTLGIAQYSESQMLQILHDANFNAQRRRPNLGHNPARLCFAARWR
jgi:ubiquinone/menaquinone biosynthesis C-methylase UbiE